MLKKLHSGQINVTKNRLFWYIPYSLIFKLKDSKDSKDSNSVCYNNYIHNQRKEVNKNHFLSYANVSLLH